MAAADQSTEGMVHTHGLGMPTRPLPPLCPLEGEPGAAENEEGGTMELEDEEEDCAPVRIAPEPGDPTVEEVEEHRTTHLPYRNWCADCVMGRGSGEQHRAGHKAACL